MIAKMFPFLLYFCHAIQVRYSTFQKTKSETWNVAYFLWKVHKIDREKSYTIRRQKSTGEREMKWRVAWSKQKYVNESMYWSNVSRNDWSRLSRPFEFFAVFIV